MNRVAILGAVVAIALLSKRSSKRKLEDEVRFELDQKGNLANVDLENLARKHHTSLEVIAEVSKRLQDSAMALPRRL